ncbi:MAG: hypothetical protein ACON5H_12565 [Akkermansiaceae bacterium]
MTKMLLLGILLATYSNVHAATLTLEATQDNVIYQDLRGGLSNGGSANIFTGKSWEQRELRTLIAFDTSGIPADSKIDSVSLNLTANSRQRESVVMQASLYRHCFFLAVPPCSLVAVTSKNRASFYLIRKGEHSAKTDLFHRLKKGNLPPLKSPYHSEKRRPGPDGHNRLSVMQHLHERLFFLNISLQLTSRAKDDTPR